MADPMRRLPLSAFGLCTLAAAVLVPVPALRAQVDAATAKSIVEEGLQNSRVMDILDRMTNGIGHRLTGSDNFTRACDWAADEFRSFGMEQVEKEHWDTWPITWNRGQWMGRIVLPEPIELQVATSASSIARGAIAWVSAEKLTLATGAAGDNGANASSMPRPVERGPTG